MFYPEAVGLVLGAAISGGLFLHKHRRGDEDAAAAITGAPARSRVQPGAELVAFCERLGLEHCLGRLADDGAQAPCDLVHLTGDDIDELPLTAPQRELLRVEISRLSSTAYYFLNY